MGLKKRMGCLIVWAVFFLVSYPFQTLASNGYADFTMERTLRQQDQNSNNNRLIQVPGRGEMLFYAQNNAFWADMRYEAAGSGTYRRFGAGGCCPTSVAIVFANLLPAAELGKIRPYAAAKAGGYGIAQGSMNPLNTPSGKGVLWLEYARDYQRYLPLVFGQYAVGNNLKGSISRVKAQDWQAGGGTSIRFLSELCAIYGVNYRKVNGKGNMDWVLSVRSGGLAIALANSQWHPFATGNGHYVAIVGCDEEYLYIMDPQDKAQEGYDQDRDHVLEVLEKGLVRVKLSDYRQLYISTVHVITTDEVEAQMAKAP